MLTFTSSAAQHSAQLGPWPWKPARSAELVSYTQLFMQQPAPPLPLARAELNQFKVCSVIAEEMGRWRLTRKAATMVFLLSTILREEVSVYKKRQLLDKHFEMIWKSLVPQIQACPGLQQLQGVFSCHYTYQPTELYKKAGYRLQGRQQLFKTLLVIASF